MTTSSGAFQPPAAPAVPAGWHRQRLLNVWVDDLPRPALLQHLLAKGGLVFTVNPDHLWHLQRHAAFLAAYRQADVITMDSAYVQKAMAWSGRPVRHRITGSDLVPALIDEAVRTQAPLKVFLLGAQPGVAQQAMDRINARVGQRVVVGALGPSMGFVDDEAEIQQAIAAINASGANALLVGLGAPKQEIWLARYRQALPGVRILMGVGATLDYEAGAVRRAPLWLRRLRLEWTYRVVTEPRRYLMRYVRNARFVVWMWQDACGRYRDPL